MYEKYLKIIFDNVQSKKKFKCINSQENIFYGYDFTVFPYLKNGKKIKTKQHVLKICMHWR